MAKIRFENTLTTGGGLHEAPREDILYLCSDVIRVLPSELIFAFSTDADTMEVIVRLIIERSGSEYPVGIFKGPYTSSPFQLREKCPLSRIHKDICDALRPSTLFSYFTDKQAVVFSVDVARKVIQYRNSWEI